MNQLLLTIFAWLVHLLSVFSTTIIHIKTADVGSIILALLVLIFGVGGVVYISKLISKESSSLYVFAVALIVFFIVGFVASYFDTIEKPCVGDTCSIENNNLGVPVESGGNSSVPIIDLNSGGGY